MKRRRALLIAALSLVFTAAVCAAFIRLLDQRRTESLRRTALEIATARAYAVEKQLDRAAAATYAAAALRRAGEAVPPDALREIRERFPIAASLFFTRPDQSAEDASAADRAQQSRSLVFSAPISGQSGLVSYGYLPLFRENEFQGFVVVVTNIRDVLESANVGDLSKQGFDYSIVQVDPDTRRETLVARSTELALKGPVTVSIAAPGAAWSLSAAPRGGWRPTAGPGREAVIALVASLVVGLFVYDLLRRPERLEQEVETRARRLLETNRKLMDETTERERAQEQARHEATHDQLTGLPNRAHFLNRVGRLQERSHADPAFTYAVLVLDIDRFKSVNDSLGPPAGDQLLQEAARRLERAVRPEDTVARVGGDEFAILVFNTADVLDVTHIAQRAQEELQLPFELGGEQIFASASIGIAFSTTGYTQAEEPLRDAHLAMNAAKREGGARHGIFDRAMHQRALEMSRIERDLRPALDRNELRIFYQPIISLEKGQVAGFEALIRWKHPERGFISPAAFLPVAESTGLIVPIDRWVLRQAAQYVKELNDGGPRFSISVNLSGKQFSAPDLVPAVERSLQESKLEPEQLRLEITESVMMENADSAFRTLQELKKLDVNISLDDFGTGYSSLSYIRQFPIDVLKIDRSFVMKMTENAKDEEIVRMIVVLANTLGLKVVAEGVETAQHLEHLRALGCAFGQGYLFSKPIDQIDLGQFLAKNPRW